VGEVTTPRTAVASGPPPGSSGGRIRTSSRWSGAGRPTV